MCCCAVMAGRKRGNVRTDLVPTNFGGRRVSECPLRLRRSSTGMTMKFHNKLREGAPQMSTPLWRLVEEWRDSQPIPPTWARVAKRLGVSQSAFDKWKNPTEMPQRRTLWAIHELTRVPFKTVVDAAIESVDLYNSTRAKEAAEAHYRKHVQVGAGEHSVSINVGEAESQQQSRQPDR